jgi:hypothetical protein
MPRPSHPPCFDHPNNTGRRVQTMQLLIMQLSEFQNGGQYKYDNEKVKLLIVGIWVFLNTN